MQNKYDYVVIGSGPAGYVSAIQAAQTGLKTAVVEKDTNMLGGVCLNEGCIPAKSIYNSAKIFAEIKRMSASLGLETPQSEIDLAGVVAKSVKASEQLRKGILFLFKKNDIDMINGTAAFIDAKTITVKMKDGSEETMSAKNFLIATGSGPKMIPGIDVDGENVVVSSQAIRIEKVPQNILVIGAGAIGVEFASFCNLIGSKVCLVEAMDRILPEEDGDISKRLQAILKQRGLTVLTSSKVESMETVSGGKKVVIDGGPGKHEDIFDMVLVSVGRAPVTAGLNLEALKVKTDEKGFISVDASMRTSVNNIFAAGDVVASPMLAHMASFEGETAAKAAAGMPAEKIDHDCVPNIVYTDIETASVGITEEKAVSSGLDFSAGKQFFKSNGRAVATGKTEGFIKIIADNKTHKLLGVHILGHKASEIIHEFVIAKKAGMTVENIANTVHGHPTLSETAIDACRSVFGKPIHG